MTRLLNNSFVPDAAEVPAARKQQRSGLGVECPLPSSPYKFPKCIDDFRK